MNYKNTNGLRKLILFACNMQIKEQICQEKCLTKMAPDILLCLSYCFPGAMATTDFQFK